MESRTGLFQGRLINFGLLEAASRSPDVLAGLPPEQIQGMLKISLLGLNQGEPTNDATLIEQIEERLIEAVQKHLNWNARDFHRWLWEDFDNLVQQISQRRGGERVTRPVVRFVLYDLLWRAHSYVDSFVRLQMQARAKPTGTGINTGGEARIRELVRNAAVAW